MKRYGMYAVMVALAFGFAFVLVSCADSETTLKEEAPAAPPTEATLPAEEAAPEEAAPPEAPKIYQLKSITTNYIDQDDDETDETYSTTISFSYEDGKLQAMFGTRNDAEAEEGKEEKSIKREFAYNDNGKLTKLTGSVLLLTAVSPESIMPQYGNSNELVLESPTSYKYLSDGKLSTIVSLTHDRAPSLLDTDMKMKVNSYDKGQNIKMYAGTDKNNAWSLTGTDIKLKFNDAGLVTEKTQNTKVNGYTNKKVAKTYKYDADNRLTEEKVSVDTQVDGASQDLDTRTFKIIFKDGAALYSTYEIHNDHPNDNYHEVLDRCYVTEAKERNDAGLIKKETVSTIDSSCKGWLDSKMKLAVERTFEWDPVAAEPVMPDLTVIFDNMNMDVFYAMHSLLWVEQPKKIFSINWPNQ